MIGKKLLTAVLVALGVILAMAIIMLFFPRGNSEETDASSAAESTAALEMLVVPSDMPEGFSMQVPQPFEETSSDVYKTYYVKDDASVIVTGGPLNYIYREVDSYSQSVIRQYQDTVDEFELLEDEKLTISGKDAHLLEFSYAIIGEDARQDFKCTTAVIMNDDMAYLVTCKSHADTYSQYRELFRMMMSTIDITDLDEDSAADASKADPSAAMPEDSVQP